MRASRLLAVLTLCWLVGACPSNPETIVSVDVVLKDRQAVLPLDLDRAQARLGSVTLPGFRFGKVRRGQTGWQLTARLPLVTDRTDDAQPGLRRRAVGVDLRLQRLGEGEGQGLFVVEALEKASVPAATPPDRLLDTALETAVDRMRTVIGLSTGRPDRIDAALRGSDAHARAAAIELVRDRKITEAAPALVDRLESGELSLQEVLRIAGALRIVGGPESVPALIDAVSAQPGAAVPLMFILSEIGGEEAEAYLFTVQSGHPRPEVREAAKDALGERRARAR